VDRKSKTFVKVAVSRFGFLIDEHGLATTRR
jgi:hypothetical protein